MAELTADQVINRLQGLRRTLPERDYTLMMAKINGLLSGVIEWAMINHPRKPLWLEILEEFGMSAEEIKARELSACFLSYNGVLLLSRVLGVDNSAFSSHHQLSIISLWLNHI